MINRDATLNLAQPFSLVNPPINTQISLFPDSMTHHKVHHYRGTYIVLRKGQRLPPPYGVSLSRRVLTPGLLLKYFDKVRDFCQETISLPCGEREAVLRLLRLSAYYGQVYPKAETVCADPGCSRSTFFRALRRLEAAGLVTVVNRFIIRPHAQISNLYKFDKLLLMIARYLAEHGVAFGERWLAPYLAMAGSVFWRSFVVHSSAEFSPSEPRTG